MLARFWGTRGSLPVALTSQQVCQNLISAVAAAQGRSFSDNDEIARCITGATRPPVVEQQVRQTVVAMAQRAGRRKEQMIHQRSKVIGQQFPELDHLPGACHKIVDLRSLKLFE